MNTLSTTRKIINIVLIVIIVLLLTQNLNGVYVTFLVFSIRLPLIIIMIGMFLAWWYTSKSFGGTFSKAQFEESLSSVEKKVGTSVEKATDTVKNTVEEIKEQIYETKKIPTPTKKSPTKKIPTPKATPRKPIAKINSKK